MLNLGLGRSSTRESLIECMSARFSSAQKVSKDTQQAALANKQILSLSFGNCHIQLLAERMYLYP